MKDLSVTATRQFLEMDWSTQPVPPVTLRTSHIHVCPQPRSTARKLARGIWWMGEDATKQTFIVPDVTSYTVATAPRILCFSSTHHSHNLWPWPSALNIPKLAFAGDTICAMTRCQRPISVSTTASRGNFIDGHHSPPGCLVRYLLSTEPSPAPKISDWKRTCWCFRTWFKNKKFGGGAPPGIKSCHQPVVALSRVGCGQVVHC